MAKRKLSRQRPPTSSRTSIEPATGEELETLPSTRAATTAPSRGETSVLVEAQPVAERPLTEITGRSWPDIIHPYSSDPRYLYVVLPIAVLTIFGATGHLVSVWDLGIAGLVAILSCVLTLLVQRRK